jgi:hypothetical protein
MNLPMTGEVALPLEAYRPVALESSMFGYDMVSSAIPCTGNTSHSATEPVLFRTDARTFQEHH